MRRDDRRAGQRFWWLVGVVAAVVLGKGWAQGDAALPQVTFLEPKEDTVIPTDTDTVTVRFRLTSPDGTNLMRYQPFVNGHAGNDPIPIDPPSPEVELALVWRGVRQFPDGIYTITIRVADAKGREGVGSLRLIKGLTTRPPKVEIVAPQSGALVRGTVMILVRARDDKGLRGLVVRAREQATSRDQSIYTGTLRGQEVVEVQVRWNTADTHPQTGAPLFPDGVYLLQAWVVNEEGQRTFSDEVLVVVQNKVAQPVLSPATPAPSPRGGATVGVTGTAGTTGNLIVPAITITPLLASLTPTPTSEAMVQPQWASVQGGRPSLRWGEVGHRVRKAEWRGATAPPLPAPQVAEGQAASRPSPHIAAASQQPQPAASLSATAPLPPPQTAQKLGSGRVGMSLKSVPPQVAPPLPSSVPPVPSSLAVARPVEASRAIRSAPLPQSEGRASVSSAEPRYVLLAAGRLRAEPPAGRLITARLPEPERTFPSPDTPHLASLAADHPASPSPQLQPLHGFRYTVIAGDTLHNLAARFGLTPEQLAVANDLPVNAPLRIGQRLWVPAPAVKVWVDGHWVASNPPAFLRDGVAVGSFRALVEASGGRVTWDNERKQAMAVIGDRYLLAAVGRQELVVNGERLALPLAIFLLGNRTFLPLRALGQGLGKEVQWRRGAVVLSSPE